jgi:hypothetical protein
VQRCESPVIWSDRLDRRERRIAVGLAPRQCGIDRYEARAGRYGYHAGRYGYHAGRYGYHAGRYGYHAGRYRLAASG